MSDSHTRSSPPVALRVVRPYRTEDELLAVEAGAFTRAGVVLIGAPSRPNGVVLRFEIVLRDGTAVMRGEGRVVGHRAPTSSEEGALILRFTRLDVKSKALLDRAVALGPERQSLPPSTAAPETAPVRNRPPLPRPPPRTRPPSPGEGTTSASRPVSAIPTAPRGADESGEAAEINSVDLAEAEVQVQVEGDATEQAPPVKTIEAKAIEAGPAPSVPGSPETMPAPSRSPARVPAVQPEPAPPVSTPPHEAPEHTGPRAAEHAPPPSPSPEPVRRAQEASETTNDSAGTPREERPSAAVAQRDSALERLRERARRTSQSGT